MADVIRELATRSQGRVPAWLAQSVATGAPSGRTAGVSVLDAVVTMVAASARKEVDKFASRVTVDAFDLTVSVYDITVDGNLVSYDASSELPVSNAELLLGLADAINTDVTVNLLVTATVEDLDGDGVGDSVTLRNKGGEAATHTTEIAVTGGVGALTLEEDSTGFGVRLYLLPVNSSSAIVIDWIKPRDAEFSLIDYRGFGERFNTSSGDRLYVEIYDVLDSGSVSPAPNVDVFIGPTQEE